MKLELKRQLFAWVLLSVFLPMMAMATLHAHSECDGTELTCQACVNHQAHAGHLSSTSGHLHDCVLCQLLNAHFLVVSVVILPFLVACNPSLYAFLATTLTCAPKGIVCLRAPPCRG